MNYIIRFAVVLLTLFLLSCKNSNNTSLSQPKNDSIKKYLELASNDTLPIPDRNKYNKKAFSFIDLSKNDTLTRYYLTIIGTTYNKINKIKELKVTTDILYKNQYNKTTQIKLQLLSDFSINIMLCQVKTIVLYIIVLKQKIL